MTPTPAQNGMPVPPSTMEDDVCITGIAGCFPNSNSVQHLAENLFNKVDLISDDERRWRKEHPEIPQRTGKIYNVEKFDAPFFGKNLKQAHTMEPMTRLVLERVYECIIDAGVNPSELNNTRTGVYVGACVLETAKMWAYDITRVEDGGGDSPCFHSMLATQVSQWLNIKGPSCLLDTACSSSLYALDHAYKAVRDRHCDAAIVVGVNLCLHPSISLLFYRMGILSADGRCKSFDNRANGYVRSESVVACFLQRAKDSRRIHAKLVHTKTNCDGYKVQGITYPAGHIQKMLLDQFYVECGVPPSIVEFMEAHGTGTSVGDPEEVGAIDEVFCKDRKRPLLIGSVKSNLGHSEGSSGMNSVAKACIAYNTGYLPPNMNFEIPRKECPSLMEGCLQVVTEKLPWNRGLFAISSFGFGGANAHVLLENFPKKKISNGLPNDVIPRLVCVSGRTESAVAKILTDLASRPVDKDEVRLWHAIHERDILGHDYRGYVLLDSLSLQGKSLAYQIECIADVPPRRSVWFKYTDLHLHWPAIAKQCMILPAFVKAIHKCSLVLKSKNINLIKLFNDDISRQREFTIVGAAAVYIGLTDVLKAGGIMPDYVVSYDIGELCSAYADEYLTVEQTINAAYEINMALKHMLTTLSVIKVKHNYQSVADVCPEDTHMEYNKHSNCTIIIAPTTKILNITNFFASRNVPLDLIGFNNSIFSRYVHKKVPKSTFSTLVNHSKRWVSSYSQSKENTKTFNPKNAIVIEIGLHGDLETFSHFKWFKKDNTVVSLISETNHDDSVLKNIGRLYLEGLNPSLANIYPAVPFPVAQGTPMMSHLVEWDHCDDWTLADYSDFFITRIPFGQRTIKFYMADDRHDYLSGHTIDDRVIFPATGYLYLVWESFSNMTNRLVTKTSVVFEEVYFQRATNVPKTGTLVFKITIHYGSGTFELTENDTSIVTGRIRDISDIEDKCTLILRNNENNVKEMLSSKDFYKELNIRGYQYKGLFRGVRNCAVDDSHGQLAWNDNWVTFLDTMLQVKIVSQDTRALYVPTRIEKITINASKHNQIVSELELSRNEKLIKFENFSDVPLTRAGGVEVRGVHVSSIFKKPPKGIPVLEKNLFIANFSNEKMPLAAILRCNLQLIHENIQAYKFKNIELVDEEYKANNLKPVSEDVSEILADLPMVQAELLVISDETIKMPPNVTVANKKLSGESNTVLLIGANLLKRRNILQEAVATLKKDCFILSREKTYNYEQNDALYDIITVYFTELEYFVLLRSKRERKQTKYLEITTKDLSFSWIEDVKKELRKEQQELVLYVQNEPVNGLLGLVNCLRKEPGGEMVRALLIADPTAPSFSAECNFYNNHLDKNLCINVFKDGSWGTYRHLLLEELETVPAAHAYANVATVGDLNSLRFWEGHLADSQTLPKSDRILINVYCAALNFRDVMTALGRVSVDAVARGRLAQDCVQGLEVAGRTTNGTRVIGICSKGLSNLVEADPTFFWPIPDEWSFEEAATVPVAYMTVYMALVIVGKIRRGESILIHAGSGGVGQAAISVALHYGLEVFTTVGTPAKREFIKKLFPQVKDSHIGNSRDTSFEHMIKRETNGDGVNLILNSLADEKLQASLKCLKQNGRFLEIGKYDITINTQLETCFLQKGISFHGIMLDYISEGNSRHVMKSLRELLLKGIQSGAVRPLINCSFEKNELQAAYRYMAAGKHIGKVVIKIREEEPVASYINPMPTLIDAVPRYTCKEDRVYVLVGGLGGFGLELADWLVLRGARKIVMCSRRGISNGYQALRIRMWTSYGVHLQISTHNVTTEKGCEEMLRMAAAMGPVQAIFNLAVVLNDAVFQNQTPATFKKSLGPKAMVTMFLDRFSRIHCPQLKDFVIFSSVSCGRGNAGQTNYGFSNSVMERICEERKRAGLPALAIQWGAIGDVGLVADMQEENVQLEIGGTLQQKISSCLQVLDKFLKQDVTIVSSIVVAEKRAANAGVDSVVDVIGQILGIGDLKNVSQQAPLSEMGMDSVMAVEIKQTLERDYELFLTAQEIRMLTFVKLTELTAKDCAEKISSSSNAKEYNDVIATAGLEMFVRNFGDEEMASKPYIYFNSDKKTTNSDSNNVLFMLPGIESCASTFATLCSKIDAKTCVLQLGLHHDQDVEQIVDRLHKTIKPLLLPNAPFSLLGYSFGSLPILKLAAKLENEGHKGIVFSVDGSAEYLKSIVNEFFNVSDDAELQNKIVCHSFNKICRDYNLSQILMKELKNIETFENKINYAIKSLPTELKYSNKFMYSMAKVTFDRIKMISKFETNKEGKINSPIVLIRVRNPPLNIQCNEKYGLDKCTNSSVTLHCINANHTTIAESEECAKIINSVLSQIKYENILG